MSVFELVGALAAVVALFGYINHRVIRLPDTVGITAMGLALATGGYALAERLHVSAPLAASSWAWW